VKNRTLVIGDIHGGLAALKQVFDRAQITPSDTLIFLGDYTDGWSESFGIVELLLGLSQNQDCVLLKGNHDGWTEDWLRTNVIDNDWYKQGGESTCTSYANAEPATKKAHLRFFERLKNYYVDNANRLFVHAGFTSPRGPAHEPDPDQLIWDRSLWEMTWATDRSLHFDSPNFPPHLKLFSEIYLGHTPTIRYGSFAPIRIFNVCNMDTGAAFFGKLSLMDVDTKQVWQSDTVMDLYPGEKGRNKS
jgi:serine/threonine protein phosphatase 1